MSQKRRRTTSPPVTFQIALWWSCQVAPSSHALQRGLHGCLSLSGTARSHVFQFLCRSQAYLKMSAQLGSCRRQGKQECITHGLLSISTSQDRGCLEFCSLCITPTFCWTSLLSSRPAPVSVRGMHRQHCWGAVSPHEPTAFLAGAVLQKARWKGAAWGEHSSCSLPRAPSACVRWIKCSSVSCSPIGLVACMFLFIFKTLTRGTPLTQVRI